MSMILPIGRDDKKWHRQKGPNSWSFFGLAMLSNTVGKDVKDDNKIKMGYTPYKKTPTEESVLLLVLIRCRILNV